MTTNLTNVDGAAPHTDNVISPIEEPILNHLNMKTTGALLLTGDWGSGKTYHIKKHIFPLIEKETKFIPIIISLYGETDKTNIAQKVLFAYLDNKGKNTKLNTSAIVKGLKQFSDAATFLKKYIDIEKLILGTGDNVFRLISHDNLLICFDDIERMSEKVNVDDFLGIINDLVENRGCKVLLIANEAEIKNGITFKEKTVEKTIHFIPNLNEIFDSIISEYQAGFFKTYLISNKESFIQTLTAKTDDDYLNKELTKSFSNIRTLKFALEHFKISFNLLANEREISALLSMQLKNIWLFTLSISIEFRKANNISLTERKNLNNQTSTIVNFDFGKPNLQNQYKSANIEEVDSEWRYSENFKKMYYNRLSESYIYYEEIYNLITSGKKIIANTFKHFVDESFRVKEGKVNPAHQILNTLLHQGYWSQSNESFAQMLHQLLIYCENGKLEDIVSYLNAGVYLIGFSEIIGVDKSIITNKIKSGLDIFLPSVNINELAKSQFEMVQSNFTGEHINPIVEHIKTQIKKIDEDKAAKEAENFQSLFEIDLVSFVKEFLPNKYDIRSPSKPLFHKLQKEAVKIGIKNATPEGVMNLASLLKIRYLDTGFSEYLTEELKFLNALEEGISEMNFSEKTLSNHLVSSQLNPVIIESKKKLQAYIVSVDES